MVKCQLEQTPPPYRHSCHRDWPQWGGDATSVHTLRDGTLCTHGLAQAWHPGSRAKEGGGQQGELQAHPSCGPEAGLALPRGLPRPATPEEACCTASQGEGPGLLDSPCRLQRPGQGSGAPDPHVCCWRVPGKSLSSWPCHGVLRTQDQRLTPTTGPVPAQPAQQRLHHPGLPPLLGSCEHHPALAALKTLDFQVASLPSVTTSHGGAPGDPFS